jgi:hypothetical protein
MKDLIGGTCDIYMYIYNILVRKHKGDYLGLGVNGRIILKWILKIQGGRFGLELPGVG